MDRIQYLQMMQQPQSQQSMGGGVPYPIESPGLLGSAPQNPLFQGSQAAMQNIRNSLQMNQQDRQRAFWLGLMQFFKNMGNPNLRPPNSGFNGALAAATQSIDPAMQAYLQEQQRVAQENAFSMEFAEKLRRQQLDEALEREKFNFLKQQHAEKMSFEREKLKGDTASNELFMRREMGLIPKDATPLNLMNKQEAAASAKELRERVQPGNNLKNTLEILDEIQKETDKYPDMSEDVARMLVMKESGEKPSAFDLIKLMMIDKRKRASLEKVGKLTNKLITQEVKASGGRTATDIYKKMLRDSTANYGMTKESIDYIVNGMRKEFMPLYKDSLRAREALANRYYVPRSIEEYSSPEESSNIPTESSVSEVMSEPAQDSDKIIIETIKRNMPESASKSDRAILEFSKTPQGQRILMGNQ